ncbi:hypothetical protein QR680_009826 [Steinernema hermaphroditum]|uniref:Uncharacterized protein n=1 Tax=Steinernema hermaphroditum TaxID=289476 RepID=A0AA39ILS1_9BILA|nr:hypothetical protein QR680_009826 [Steinernema hermaphroditum]
MHKVAQGIEEVKLPVKMTAMVPRKSNASDRPANSAASGKPSEPVLSKEDEERVAAFARRMVVEGRKKFEATKKTQTIGIVHTIKKKVHNGRRRSVFVASLTHFASPWAKRSVSSVAYGMGQSPRDRHEKRQSKSEMRVIRRKGKSTASKVKFKDPDVGSCDYPSAVAVSNSDCLNVSRGNAQPDDEKPNAKKCEKDDQQQINVKAPRAASLPVPRNCIKISRSRISSLRHTELRYVSYSRLSENAVVERPLSLCDLLAEMITTSNSALSKSSGKPSSPILTVYLNMARISALGKMNEQLKCEKSYIRHLNAQLECTIEAKKNFDAEKMAKKKLLEGVVGGLEMLADEKIKCDAATAHLRQGAELQNLIRQMEDLNIGVAKKSEGEQKEILQSITKIRQSIATALTSGARAR